MAERACGLSTDSTVGLAAQRHIEEYRRGLARRWDQAGTCTSSRRVSVSRGLGQGGLLAGNGAHPRAVRHSWRDGRQAGGRDEALGELRLQVSVWRGAEKVEAGWLVEGHDRSRKGGGAV